MNKKLVLLTAILVVSVGFLSGCNELTGDTSLSPSEVRNHPEKYLGEKITVHGIYVSVYGAAHLIAPLDYKSNSNANIESIVAELEDGIECFDGGEYYFTGTLEKQAYTNLPMLVVTIVDTEYVDRITNNEQTKTWKNEEEKLVGTWKRDVDFTEHWEFTYDEVMYWGGNDFYYKIKNDCLYMWSADNYDNIEDCTDADANWIFIFTFINDDELKLEISEECKNGTLGDTIYFNRI